MVLMAMLVMPACFTQQNDVQILTPDNFIHLIRQHHPIAKQSAIRLQSAEAGLLAASGNFDPELTVAASGKTFTGKDYYQYQNAGLKIPLPVGNLSAGIENNKGDYLLTELSKGQSSFLGVELPLASGLVTDKRRAALQKAKTFVKQSEQERLAVLNDLFFDAYKAYWQWAGCHQLVKIYDRFMGIAQERLRLVKIGYDQGDRARADTLEAFAQLQSYAMQQNEAQLKLREAELELSNFLWAEDNLAYQLPQNYLPDSTMLTTVHEGTPVATTEIAPGLDKNPTLESYRHKLAWLGTEKKLKFQSLLPYVALKYNVLNKEYQPFKNLTPDFVANNNKFSIQFSMPLFLREARGEYKKAQLKISETNLEFMYKKQQLLNKIKLYLNEQQLVYQQLLNAQQVYNSYWGLLQNELLKFRQGESALFLVNSRENKVIELLQKKNELHVKYQKAIYAAKWAAGTLVVGLPAQ